MPGHKEQLARGLASDHAPGHIIITPGERGLCVCPVRWAGPVSCHGVRERLGFWRPLRRKSPSGGGGALRAQAGMLALHGVRAWLVS